MATTAVLLPPLCFREEDGNGQPLAFGTVQSFQAGTVTPVATYTDSTGATPNANPLTLNNRGEANIWVLPNVGYKFLVKDAAGNQVRVVDNVQNSQLLTLYGGVDTGVTNAYVLNFTASFSAYTDGIVIYWIPSHTNTGASTINVNGLGVVNITNTDGSALFANTIVVNQPTAILFKSGSFLLMPQGFLPVSGSWLPTFTGFAVAPSANVIQYSVVSNRVEVQMYFQTGTSNSAAFTINNMPALLKPARQQAVHIVGMVDNGATINTGTLVVDTAGIMNFYVDESFSGWNAGAVQKGLFGAAQRYRTVYWSLL